MKNIIFSFLVFISTFLNAQWDYVKFDNNSPDNNLFYANYNQDGKGI